MLAVRRNTSSSRLPAPAPAPSASGDRQSLCRCMRILSAISVEKQELKERGAADLFKSNVEGSDLEVSVGTNSEGPDGDGRKQEDDNISSKEEEEDEEDPDHSTLQNTHVSSLIRLTFRRSESGTRPANYIVQSDAVPETQRPLSLGLMTTRLLSLTRQTKERIKFTL